MAAKPSSADCSNGAYGAGPMLQDVREIMRVVQSKLAYARYMD